MNVCRNCGAENTKDLGFIGALAPFFLKRVLNLECGLPPSGHPVKRFLRGIGLFSGAIQKIYGSSALAEIQICLSCSFIQTKVPFPEEAIARLYADYRSDSYNRERIQYEPEYGAIASQVGLCHQEVQERTVGLARWLKGKLNLDGEFSMLDYGGADGRFLPDIPGKKYVFDISAIAPVEGVVKVKNESDLASYSYIQLAHVLEHVPYPLDLTRKAASLLKESGYLYIEVPQELSDDQISRLLGGDSTIRVDIHEHINRYCAKSVTQLLQAAGISPVEIHSEEVNMGWTKATVVRALGRRL